ncbi:DUF6603 domain-containing protein [Nocardia sp. NPDC050793]|uniref:DUF6603 domain-containing protein n=1 Tax=Nocardia sp. NPDC050793 TaxID=3155159 RepID=UPI0033DAD349
MTVQIGWLRKLLDEADGAPAEVPVDGFGFGDGLRVLFPDGVLRFGHDGAATREAVGTARVPFCETAAALTLQIAPDDSSAALEMRLPGPGAPAHLLARCLGFELPVLPCQVLERVDIRLDGAAGASLEASGLGTVVRMHANDQRVFTVEADGWHVVCTHTPVPLTQLAELGSIEVVRGVLPDPLATELPPGSWLLLPAAPTRPRRMLVPLAAPRGEVVLDPSRVDGLGRTLPVAQPRAHRSGFVHPPVRAVATADGFALLAGTGSGSERGNGRWALTIGEDGAVADVTYDYDPLMISGALGLLNAQSPYKTIIGGVLMFSFKGAKSSLYGTGAGAYVVPESGAAKPSFFGYAGIGGNPGIGIPAIRLTGVAVGFGWNSRIRVPAVTELDDFPFVKALSDPASIGGETEDPVEILRTLTLTANPWITAKDDELWVAAGLGFTLAELIEGRLFALVQTGEELTIALMGTGAADLPKGAGRKYARIGVGLSAVIKPKQGELAFDAGLTSDSYLLDPNCRLRGGISLRTWFGPSPYAGDFVFSVGGFHPNYRAPKQYPAQPRVGFDWDLTGSVTISGNAYLAVTAGAAMAGGGLAIRFHSGVVRAWCTAQVDALIQWKPFYFDVGLKVSIGVSASVKIIFVRITITVEIGVHLEVWGPPTGGTARIKLWFISFTINFGNGRAGASNELDWPGFSALLPPAENNVRVLPGAGLLVEKHPATRTLANDYWEVSASGFTFTTDTTVPLTKIFLGTATAPAESGSTVNLRPTRWRGVTSNQRVKLTLDGAARDLGEWSRAKRTATVAAELWGSRGSGSLPSDGNHVVPDQLLGAAMTSPAPRHGTSTGFIDQEAIAFDPVDPDGAQPLDPNAGPVGALPTRPGGVIATIAATVAATEQTAARQRLAGQLTALGFDLGALDNNLSGYARACQTAFTAEPMLVSAN